MNRIVIQPFGIATTQLGFGCSSLLGFSASENRGRLIDAAYDAGIRHFDVARSYGSGRWKVARKTLGSRRADVTITTKFGLPVPRNPALVRRADRSPDRWLNGYPECAHAPSRSFSMAATIDFTADAANQSLRQASKNFNPAMSTCFFFMSSGGFAYRSATLDFLHEAIQDGKIKGHGVGSDLAVLPNSLSVSRNIAR